MKEKIKSLTCTRTFNIYNTLTHSIKKEYTNFFRTDKNIPILFHEQAVYRWGTKKEKVNSWILFRK